MNTLIYIYIMALLIILFAICMIGVSIEINISKSNPRLLGYRSKGSEVMKIQHMLNFINTTECKFDHHIREDGLFYEETLREVKFFQIDHNLKPDGFVGKETKGRIEYLYYTYKADNRFRDYYRGLDADEYEKNIVNRASYQLAKDADDPLCEKIDKYKTLRNKYHKHYFDSFHYDAIIDERIKNNE